jgi:hypothetical protein
MARRKKIRTTKMPTKHVNSAQKFMNEMFHNGRTNMYGAIPYLIRYCKLDRNDAFAEVCTWVDEYNERKGIGETFDNPVQVQGSEEWLERPMPEPKKAKVKPKNPDAKPRGWHFKKYFEFQGKVYSLGKEVTNAKDIKRLKKEAGIK